jgi:hypothetical protein
MMKKTTDATLIPTTPPPSNAFRIPPPVVEPTDDQPDVIAPETPESLVVSRAWVEATTIAVERLDKRVTTLETLAGMKKTTTEQGQGEAAL